MIVINLKSSSGQSLMEVLVAFAVFVLGISAVGFLVLDAFVSYTQGADRTHATLLAKEGIEGVRAIRDADFDNLVSGTHGIVLSADRWVFSGSSDTIDKFTREITVSDVEKDIKQIQSRVSWQISQSHQSQVVLEEYFTDWNQTHGEAGELAANISGAIIAGGGNRELRDMKIENTGASSIVVDKITAWWNNNKEIEEISIDGTKVWSRKGPGSPSGRQPSGTELDIQDFVLGPGSGEISIDKVKFSGSMTGVAFIVLFEMIDGSTKYLLIEPGAAPPPSCGPEADTYLVDISFAQIGGGGNKELQGITIENIDPLCTVTIDKITTDWDSSDLIEEIKIASTKVWSRKGPGSPSGRQPSGTELDIQDFVLGPGSGALNVDKFKFNGNMSSVSFDITFVMGDGTSKTTGPFSP